MSFASSAHLPIAKSPPQLPQHPPVKFTLDHLLFVRAAPNRSPALYQGEPDSGVLPRVCSRLSYA
ncbi:hypothetical protein SCLCIDRAFT_706142 [Scleroderma citrinum Foug A]|uniref:Uncharacterized protein n=1 Tax=Scleroderma citrinum Foug A TaxID=1036808 RepID=A0A0C3ENM4_9AGAM|nr:hypothetical protein SCLCIDRAFT_706142 [Scleroderma citrinum Foug A]